jgi:hypothetical protein
VGVNLSWQENFLIAARDIDPEVIQLVKGDFELIIFNTKLVVHLVPLVNHFTAESLIHLQTRYKENNQILVHLWEDIWCWKREQVISRINSFMGLNKSLHGRKAKIKPLDTLKAKTFFNSNHLQGFVTAKFYYALVVEEEVVAAAGFSSLRPMKSKGEEYKSAELIRFASKAQITVVGGLSKLIRHFFKQLHFNDLMSYTDRDWSLGAGYDRLGFNLTETTKPAILYVNTITGQRYFPHRLPKEVMLTFEAQKTLNLDDFLVSQSFHKVFNTGNLKYHFYR